MIDYFELRYVTPPAERSFEAYRGYVEQHLLVNKRCIGRPELYETPSAGFHVRQVGRSTLIALSLIEEARANPGEFIEYRDHCYGTNKEVGRSHIRKKVKTIVGLLPQYEGMRERFVVDNKKGFVYDPTFIPRPEFVPHVSEMPLMIEEVIHEIFRKLIKNERLFKKS